MRDSLETYVSRKLRGDTWIDFVFAGAAVLGGGLIVTMSYYVALAVIWIVLLLIPGNVPNMTLWARIGGGLVVVLAFVESWRDQRKLFEGYTNESGPGGVALSTGLYLLGVGWGPRSLIPLSPATSRNSVRVLADLLCSGPRLLTNAVRLVRRGHARATSDFDGCARVLAMALENPGRLPFKHIKKEHPDLDLLAVAEQLSWLDGVVLLRTEPPGITLTDGLREELVAAL